MGFFDIVVATIPVFLIVGVGMFSRRIGMIDDHSEKNIMRLILNVLYPCFILSKVPGNDSLRDPSVVVSAIGAGFGLTITGMVVAYLVARLFKISKAEGRNTFCLGAALQNYGFIPIPLIEAFFPREVADETLGVLFVHNLGLEIALWTVGIVVISGSLKGSAKRLLNGPTIGIVLGLTLNFTGLHHYVASTTEATQATWFLPGFLTATMNQLGNCSIPISLVLVGAAIYGVVEREVWKTDWKVVSGASLIRFVIMPAIFMTAAYASFSPELQRVLLIEAAMPSAIFPIVIAKHFGGKPAVATQIVIFTTVFSIALTPVLITIGMRLFPVAPI